MASENATIQKYEPMTDQARANVQSIIDKLTEVGDAIGGWTAKWENRQTGASYHAKFENRVDVMVTMEWVNQLQSAPALLADACRKLLAADAALSAELGK